MLTIPLFTFSPFFKMIKAQNFAPTLHISQKIPESPCLYIYIIYIYIIYQLTKFGDSMNCDLKDIFKYVPCHKYHDVTNLVNQGMVLGFLYLKSGSKHETCFYNYTFQTSFDLCYSKVVKTWLVITFRLAFLTNICQCIQNNPIIVF